VRETETLRATERVEVEAQLHHAQASLATALGNQRLRDKYHKQVTYPSQPFTASRCTDDASC
jgi:hypothetical protein